MDAFVQEALKAVEGLASRGRQPVPNRTEKNASPHSSGGRVVEVNGSGGLQVTTKGVGYMTSDDEPTGSALNPQAQLGLFSKIRRESAWLRLTSFVPVTENTGFLDLWEDQNFRM